MSILTIIIGKTYSTGLINDIRKEGYVLRVVYKDGKTFPHQGTAYRHERVNIHLENKKIIHYWIG